MNIVISMMILCFRLCFVAGYLGLKLNNSLSNGHLTWKQRELKHVKLIPGNCIFMYINSVEIGLYNLCELSY